MRRHTHTHTDKNRNRKMEKMKRSGCIDRGVPTKIKTEEKRVKHPLLNEKKKKIYIDTFKSEGSEKRKKYKGPLNI